jgi:IclR family pca regulon transcriptional regulator
MKDFMNATPDIEDGDQNQIVTAFARGLAVIQAFGPSRPHPTLAELAKATGLPRATVRRCMHTLVALGYAQSNGRFFTLLPKILTLGYSYLSTTPLPRIGQPFLERISERINESCSMSVLEGDDIVYIARAATKRIMSVGLSVGSHLPAFCTSMGRVLLAAKSDDELQRWMTRTTLPRHTVHTVTAAAALLEIVRAVRKQGFAVVDQELEIGLRSVAVPVFGPNNTVLAAINVSAQAGRVDLEFLRDTVLKELLKNAADMSAALGG